MSIVGPRVIRAEVPEVPLGILARIAAPTIILIGQRIHDGGASSDRTIVMRVGISDNDVWTLRSHAAGARRRCLKLSERIVAPRTKHDHARTECQLGMRDG